MTGDYVLWNMAAKERAFKVMIHTFPELKIDIGSQLAIPGNHFFTQKKNKKLFCTHIPRFLNRGYFLVKALLVVVIPLSASHVTFTIALIPAKLRNLRKKNESVESVSDGRGM